MTKKLIRPHARDYSQGGKTDTSFGPSCDVNNIVRHYETTGIDPFPDRLAIYQKQAASQETAEASVLSYEDAMRNKAAYDSYILENPAEEPTGPPISPAEPEPKATDGEAVAKPAPQGASDGES